MTIFTDTPPDGLFVTIEGPNGAGKTSLSEAVATRLQAAGQRVHRTKQPSPTPLGDTVRAAERTVTGRALACLVAGDRHHQARTEILPMLSDSRTVLCDRYIESSLVLQRYDGVATDYILAINSGIPRPTMRIRLKAEPATLTRRLAEREVLPERRFEHGIGAVRELELYEEADQLLLHREQLEAHIFDTTMSNAAELGSVVAELILSRR